MSGPTYTLRFKNRSGSPHNFFCFQQGIDINRPNISPLAWFAKPVANGVDVDFTWTLEYGFVWIEQGALASGIAFKAAQYVPADPETANLVSLSYQSGAFRFGQVSGSGTNGSLAIECDTTIPPNVASVGIGMSGAATHLVPAEPNFTAMFRLHPEYWIGVGSYAPGQALDASALVASTQIEFPPNIYEMTATLDADNKWTITQELT